MATLISNIVGTATGKSKPIEVKKQIIEKVKPTPSISEIKQNTSNQYPKVEVKPVKTFNFAEAQKVKLDDQSVKNAISKVTGLVTNKQTYLGSSTGQPKLLENAPINDRIKIFTKEAPKLTTSQRLMIGTDIIFRGLEQGGQDIAQKGGKLITPKIEKEHPFQTFISRGITGIGSTPLMQVGSGGRELTEGTLTNAKAIKGGAGVLFGALGVTPSMAAFNGLLATPEISKVWNEWVDPALNKAKETIAKLPVIKDDPALQEAANLSVDIVPWILFHKFAKAPFKTFKEVKVPIEGGETRSFKISTDREWWGNLKGELEKDLNQLITDPVQYFKDRQFGMSIKDVGGEDPLLKKQQKKADLEMSELGAIAEKEGWSKEKLKREYEKLDKLATPVKVSKDTRSIYDRNVEKRMIEEAKKYKSAEEFVKAQVDTFANLRLEAQGVSRDFNNKLSKLRSEINDTPTDPYYFDFNGKRASIFKFDDLVRYGGNKMWTVEITDGGKKTVQKLQNDEVFKLKPLGKIRQEKREAGMVDTFVQDPKVEKLFNTIPSELKIKIKDPGQKLTKSQLTDIWNKAQGEVKQKEFINPINKKPWNDNKIPEDWASYTSVQKRQYLDALEKFREEKVQRTQNKSSSESLKEIVQQKPYPREKEPPEQPSDLSGSNTPESASYISGKKIKLDDTLPREALNSQAANAYKPVKQSRKLSSDMAKALFSDKELFNDITLGEAGELSTLAPIRAAESMDGKRFGIWKENFLSPLQEADKYFQIELKQKQAEVRHLFEGMGEKEKEAIFNFAEKKNSEIDNALVEKKPRIKEVSVKLRETYDQLLDRINDQRSAIGKDPISKRKDYITHYQELSVIDDILKMVGLDINDVPNSMLAISMYTKPNSPYFKFAKRRLGEKSGKDAQIAFESYLEPALRQIYFSKPVKAARDIIEYKVAIPSEYEGGKVDRVSLVAMKYPNAYKYWTSYLNTLSGKREWLDKLFPGLSQVAGVTNKLFAPGSIGGNLATVFTQVASIRNTVAETGLFSLKGQLLINTPKWYKFFSKNSRVGLGRQYEVSQSGSTLLGSKGLASAHKKISEFISVPVSVLDREMVGGSFLAGYFKGKSLGLTEKDAIRYGDDVAERTQSSGNLIDRPTVNRGKIKVALGQFQTFVYNEWSMLKKDIGGKILKGESTKQGYGDGLTGLMEGRWTGAKRLAGYVITTIALSKVFDELGIPNPFKSEDSKLPFIENESANKFYTYVVNQIPGVSSVRFGGSPVVQFVKNVVTFTTGNEEEKNNAKSKLRNLGFRLIPGGGQLQKSYDASKSLLNDGKVTSKSGDAVNYIIDTKDYWNVAKALMFGKWQTNEGQAYLKGERVKSEAEYKYEELKAMPPQERDVQFNSLKETQPKLWKEVDQIRADRKIGISSEERAIQNLGIKNGERAKKIFETAVKMETKEEKNAFLARLREGKIMTSEVEDQVVELKKQAADAKAGIVDAKTKEEELKGWELLKTYAKALTVDPFSAFETLFTEEELAGISGDAVIFKRMDVSKSQAIKRKLGSNPSDKLDHEIPLELGGDNSLDNLQNRYKKNWQKFTPVENYLGKLLKSGEIKEKEAQRLIKEFKEGSITFDEIKARY